MISNSNETHTHNNKQNLLIRTSNLTLDEKIKRADTILNILLTLLSKRNKQLIPKDIVSENNSEQGNDRD